MGWWHLPPLGFVDLSRQTSDLQLVREALRSLRNSFSGHDPQHHTIDSLEQGISSLMERLHRMEMQKRQDKRVRSHWWLWFGLPTLGELIISFPWVLRSSPHAELRWDT